MYTETTLRDPEQHLFAEGDFIQYKEASTNQRFFNFLVDSVLVRVGLAYLAGFALAYLLAYTAPEYYYAVFQDEDQTLLNIISVLLTLGIYILYYALCEKLCRGYTLGKLITGTRAVREDGEELTFKDALLRSFSRLVPFEPFSALNQSPWHDQWTKTMVIKSR